ncbi:hypothetical protein [Streptomyces sp. NPDC020747]|uniref:hypothetical protein n=1 Tax=Streptomyces sp. NPDC020747 TaxID=3365086 RepID=UPI00378C066A
MASATLALIRSNHHGHGSDVPWQFIVGYIAIGLVAWFVTAVLVLRHDQAKKGRPVDSEDRFVAVFSGLVSFIGWPLVVVGYGIWRAVEHYTRQPVDLTKNAE